MPSEWKLMRVLRDVVDKLHKLSGPFGLFGGAGLQDFGIFWHGFHGLHGCLNMQRDSGLRIAAASHYAAKGKKGNSKTLSLAESAGNAENQTRTEVQVVRTESKGNPVCLRLV